MTYFDASLSAGLPEGWFAKESITLLAPDGNANVIASSEPLDPSISTEHYTTVQGDLLAKEFPGYQQHTLEQMTIFEDRTAFRRDFEWTPPDSVPIRQIQLYYAESGRGYTATATTPTEYFAEYEMVLAAALRSLRRVNKRDE